MGVVVGVAHEAIDLVNQHHVDHISMLAAVLEHFPEDRTLAGLRARSGFDEEPLQRPAFVFAVPFEVGRLHAQAVALGLGNRGDSGILTAQRVIASPLPFFDDRLYHSPRKPVNLLS